MSIWDTIIGVVERTWRDKPRKDVVNALVELRAAMVECQRAYESYQDICRRGPYRKWLRRSRNIFRDVGTVFEDPKLTWIGSVIKLSDLTAEINEVLQIFSPEVHSEVVRMAETEWKLQKKADSRVTASELNESLKIDLRDSTLQCRF